MKGAFHRHGLVALALLFLVATPVCQVHGFIVIRNDGLPTRRRRASILRRTATTFPDRITQRNSRQLQLPLTLHARRAKKRVQANAADHGKDWQGHFDRAVAIRNNNAAGNSNNNDNSNNNENNWTHALPPDLSSWLADQQEQCRYVLGGQGKKGRITKKRAVAMERAGLLEIPVVVVSATVDEDDDKDAISDGVSSSKEEDPSGSVDDDTSLENGTTITAADDDDDDWRAELERLPDWRSQNQGEGRGRVRRQNLKTVHGKPQKKKKKKPLPEQQQDSANDNDDDTY